MATPATRSTQRRTITPLFVILTFVAVLAVPLTWLGLAIQREHNALATLRAAGEPTCFAELAPQPIPPENDANVFLSRASVDLKAFAREQGDFFRTPVGESFGERLPPTPQQIAAIGDILAHYPDLLHVLERAAACEGYTSKIDFSVGTPQMMDELLKFSKDARTPARFLRWQIAVLLAEGKQEEAVEAGLVILRLARLYEGEPAMVNGLVVIAIRAIAIKEINLALRAGPISAELREQLDDELARQDDPQRICRVMKTERAINLSNSKDLFQARLLPWSGAGLHVDMIDFYDRLLPLLDRPWHETQSQLHGLTTNDANDSDSSISSNLIELLQPALLAGIEYENRSTALLRSLRIVNQLTAYAQENGQEASGLDDLDLPPTATLDPFSGNPLKLIRTDAGWVVYTVSKDGKDDRGNFKDMADEGVGPAGYPAAD